MTGARGGPPAGASNDEAAVDLARVLASLFSTTAGAPSPLIVSTLDQWLAERPSYQQSMAALTGSLDWAVQQINKMLGVGPHQMISGPTATSPVTSPTSQGHYGGGSVRSLWLRLSPDSRRLMTAAVLLFLVLDLPPDMLPPPVVDIASRLGVVLRNSPDRISDIRRKILAEQ